VKDRTFSGQDVEEALASAAASLGLPLRDLRYVVLDPGSAGGRGLKPTPARIAVLLHEPAAGGAAAPARPEADGAEGPAEPRAPLPPREARDAATGVRAIVRAIAAAGGLDVEADIEESGDAFLVRLRGKDAAFFHGEGARGDVLYALEHLLQRTFGEDLRPRLVRLRCEGFREARDAALTEEAHQLAAEVRESGHALQMEPLNSYERRIVHLALQDEPDIRTYSVGEGMDRRVTIAPKGGDAPGRGEADDGR
jgi:spoIIIJ-associated protein